MLVIKRAGRSEELQIAKIKKFINYVTEGTNADPLELESDCHIQFRDGMTSQEIHDTITKVVESKIEQYRKEAIAKDWDIVARNCVLFDMAKKKHLILNTEKTNPYSDIRLTLRAGVEKGLYHTDLLNCYPEYALNRLQEILDGEKDKLLSYAGIRQLRGRYLIEELGEMPQELFLFDLMFLATEVYESLEARLDFIEECYHSMSNLDYMLATPSLAGARTPSANLASCNILTVPDSIEGIMDAGKSLSYLSKFGAGVGEYWGKVRASKSMVRGIKGVAKNIMSWIRIHNDIATAVDQLGRRKGACAPSLEPYHKDIYDFLNMGREAGDEKLKAYDLFPAKNIPDLFMQRVEEKGTWTLFDPYYVRKELGYDLSDLTGKAFEEAYIKLESMNLENSEVVPALEVAQRITAQLFENGIGFLMFRDTVNALNPNKHKGVIYSSNICMEILQNNHFNRDYRHYISDTSEEGAMQIRNEFETDYGQVQCNLMSVNLVNLYTEDRLERAIRQCVRLLNAVIKRQVDSIPETKIHNHYYRSIGIGTAGYISRLVRENIPFESEAHLDFSNALYERIAFYAIDESCEMAREFDPYPLFEGSDWSKGIFFGKDLEKLQYYSALNGNNLPWATLIEKVKEFGMYNGHLLATAPTSSISMIMNTSPGIDPVEGAFYFEGKKEETVPVLMPFFETKPLAYKPCYLLNQEWVIRAAAIRQEWIDQSQSTNIFLDRSTVKGSSIWGLIKLAWSLGMKTIYYFRSKDLSKHACENCES